MNRARPSWRVAAAATHPDARKLTLKVLEAVGDRDDLDPAGTRLILSALASAFTRVAVRQAVQDGESREEQSAAFQRVMAEHVQLSQVAAEEYLRMLWEPEGTE
jgi:hypothetical protein